MDGCRINGWLLTVSLFNLQLVIELLQSLHPLSIKGRILLVKMLIYYGDFITSFGESEEHSDYYYKQAEGILREEVANFPLNG